MMRLYYKILLNDYLASRNQRLTSGPIALGYAMCYQSLQ